MSDAWPWQALAGLGAFHGLNPAMGWLFAVALGLHRGSRRALFGALLPLAAGHALSIALVAGMFVSASLLTGARALQVVAGAVLIGWAVYHALYGHHRRARFGMTVGLLGLTAWSFLMATAHGAGLMLMPALAPLCLAGSGDGTALQPYGAALAAVGLHTGAMLAATATCATLVYEASALGLLRSAWINLDWLWTAALVVAGLILLAM